MFIFACGAYSVNVKKWIVIALSLVLGWCCGSYAQPAGCADTFPVARCGLAAPSGAEWLCERACNSDLYLPRPVEVQPVRTMEVRFPSDPARCGVKCAVAGGRAGSRIVSLPRYAFYPLLAGSSPADEYVYRLRRLRI